MRFAGAPQVSAFLSDRPNYGAVADLGLRARSKERQTATAAEARTHMAGLDAMAQVRAAEHQARGIKAGGQAQAAATRASGMSSMIGSIAGGIGSIDLNFGGGGGNSYGGHGSTGGLYDTVKPGDTGKYGSFQDPSADINRALGGDPWKMY